ncbi:lactate dehydrogenase, partial [Staphylococcus aureus]
TPHIAFFSDEAVQNLVEGGLNAALSVINTGTCETRLN